MRSYIVKMNRGICIGDGSCEAVAPKAFALDSEGKSVIKKKDGSIALESAKLTEIPDSFDSVLNGARSCPVSGISIIEVDEKGKEIKQIWPV